ncbi:hypothetical protein OPT61_g3160 [Boeremia exigua]|uniref:Uncharacterized protein n=1 Tax=Boeremia exigua TaxID=749465 RepID=A0ACC2IJ23_9PLEO|nr:hypothetical protein OPT61_g3160 [Boeremia exigua]
MLTRAITTEGGLRLKRANRQAAAVQHARHVRAAREGIRDHNDSTLQQHTAGPQYLCCRQADYAALLAAAARAGETTATTCGTIGRARRTLASSQGYCGERVARGLEWCCTRSTTGTLQLASAKSSERAVNRRVLGTQHSVAQLLRGRWQHYKYVVRAKQTAKREGSLGRRRAGRSDTVGVAAGARQAGRWLLIGGAGAGSARGAGEADAAYCCASDGQGQELAVHGAGFVHSKELAGEAAGDEELAAAGEPDGDADSNAAADAGGRA